MDVVSTSVLPVASVRWMSPSGAPALTVVCRATFVLQPIMARLADEQEPIVTADVHFGNDARWSLQTASDLVPYKARPEVILVGHAYAPRGQPARSVVARLAVGTVDKSVEVLADRWLDRDGEIREGALWTRRPLRYEGAAAGAARANPVGLTLDAEDVSGALPLPYLQPRGARFARRGDGIETACFGPIAPGWPQRAGLGPRLGARWTAALAADRPLPDDVDPAFFNCAPRDQQLDGLAKDQLVLLEHLHPKHARLLTSLPGIAPHAEIARVSRPPAPLALTCDTMWIDTDRATCSLVFRGTVQLAYPGEPGCVTVHLDLPDPGEDAGGDRTMAAPLASRLGASAPFPISESPSPDAGAAARARAAGSTSALPFQATPPLATGPLVTPPLAAPPLVTPHLVTPHLVTPHLVTPALPAPPPLLAPPPGGGPPTPPAMVAVVPPVAPPSPAAVAAPYASILSSPLEATPWAAPVALAAPQQAGSIGQRLALEQAIEQTPPLQDPGVTGAEPEAATEEPREDGPTEAPERGEDVLLAVCSDPGLLDVLRRDRSWREQIEAIEAEAESAGDDEPLGRIDEEDPGVLVSLLARAEPTSTGALRALLLAGKRPDRRLLCPLAVVEGTLVCSLDERESLRVLAAAALAIDPDDEALAGSVAAARTALPDGALPSPVARRLEAAISTAFRSKERAVSPRDLASTVERTLLEQRAFARRDLFDGPHVRAELGSGDEERVVVYLPDSHARALPLVRRLRVRLLVEVRPREDEQETCPVALRARAVARIHLIPTD